MLNQGFLDDHETGFFPFPANMISLPLDSNPIPTTISPSHPLLQHSKPKQDHISFQTSLNAYDWAWSEEREITSNKIIGLSSMDDDDDDHLFRLKMKKLKSRKKVREPRFCFKTMSDIDVLNDGYKWRKYGQKVVKNTHHPRSYYRCTQGNCRVKKRVERLAEDPRMVITTYEGRHMHSPSQNEEDLEAANSSKLCNFSWF